MPSSLRKEHNRILENWLEDPYRNIINKPINVFCVNLQDKLFKARILFQLLEEEGELKLFLGIIKLNERDYLAISEKGIIENVGLAFDEILPTNRKGRSAAEIFPFWIILAQKAST